MFTGIIEAVGSIAKIDQFGTHVRMTIAAPDFDLTNAEIGESIAVSGVCLTVVELGGDSFAADLSPETLACTKLGDLGIGDGVNLERALALGDRLGGHLVTGHVDGVGEVVELERSEDGAKLGIAIPAGLECYIARKGSACVDGVSLTVNTVDSDRFSVQIIPHTLDVTTIDDFVIGTRINLEVDLLARYLERLMTGQTSGAGSVIDEDLLKRSGFM